VLNTTRDSASITSAIKMAAFLFNLELAKQKRRRESNNVSKVGVGRQFLGKNSLAKKEV
jgi:hypothetical protein